MLGKIKTPRPLAGIAISPDGRTVVAVDDAQPTLFLIDTAAGKVREEIVLKDVPKAAQIARYAPDNSLLGVTSLNSDTVSLIDPSFREQTAIKVGSQPMDMAFRGDELFVACQGDGSVHVIDIPGKRVKASFQAGTGCEFARVLLRTPVEPYTKGGARRGTAFSPTIAGNRPRGGPGEGVNIWF